MNTEIKLLCDNLLSIRDKQLFLQKVRDLEPKTFSKVIENYEIGRKVVKIRGELCRICNHKRREHESDTKLADRCHDSISPYAKCECLKFIPPDNLEYLEMKVQEKV
jgi:hypothetical protein